MTNYVTMTEHTESFISKIRPSRDSFDKWQRDNVETGAARQMFDKARSEVLAEYYGVDVGPAELLAGQWRFEIYTARVMSEYPATLWLCGLYESEE